LHARGRSAGGSRVGEDGACKHAPYCARFFQRPPLDLGFRRGRVAARCGENRQCEFARIGRRRLEGDHARAAVGRVPLVARLGRVDRAPTGRLRREDRQHQPGIALAKLDPRTGRIAGLTGRDHAPTDTAAGLQAGELILDQDLAGIHQAHAAPDALGLPLVGRTHVEDRVREGRIVAETDDAAVAGGPLELPVDHQRVVPVVALSEDGPAVGVLAAAPEVHSPRLDAVVPFGPEIDGPPHAIGVQDERADVHLAVAGRGRAAFEADERGLGIGPGTAVDRDRRFAFAVPVQGHVDLGGVAGRVHPEQRQRQEAVAVGDGASAADPGRGVRHPFAFAQQPVRPIVTVGEPEQDRLRSPAGAAVGVVEELARRPARQGEILPGPVEAGRVAQAEVGSQRTFEHADQEHVVAGPVRPVAGTFGITSLRGKRPHRIGHVVQGVVDGTGGQVRFIFHDGQGTGGEAPVANLSPVVPRSDPALVLRSKRQDHALLDDRLADLRSGGLVEPVVEPVVADRQREGHLGHVEEVAGVEVGESGGRQHLLLAAADVPQVAGKVIRHGQHDDALHAAAGLAQQAPPLQLPHDGRDILDQIGLPHHGPSQRLEHRVVVGRLAHRRQVGPRGQQPRVFFRRLVDPRPDFIQGDRRRVAELGLVGHSIARGDGEEHD